MPERLANLSSGRLSGCLSNTCPAIIAPTRQPSEMSGTEKCTSPETSFTRTGFPRLNASETHLQELEAAMKNGHGARGGMRFDNKAHKGCALNTSPISSPSGLTKATAKC